MGVKTFNNGDVLTATDVNTYLMRQAVITCTSVTRPSSPGEGMTIAETDTDKLLTYDGAGWVEFSRYNAANTTATIDPAFTATTNQVYRRGSWGWLALTCNRPGGTLSAGVGVLAATIPSGYRPAVQFDTVALTPSGITVTVTFAPTGDINVRPVSLVSAGTSIVIASGAYPLA